MRWGGWLSRDGDGAQEEMKVHEVTEGHRETDVKEDGRGGLQILKSEMSGGACRAPTEASAEGCLGLFAEGLLAIRMGQGSDLSLRCCAWEGA